MVGSGGSWLLLYFHFLFFIFLPIEVHSMLMNHNVKMWKVGLFSIDHCPATQTHIVSSPVRHTTGHSHLQKFSHLAHRPRQVGERPSYQFWVACHFQFWSWEDAYLEIISNLCNSRYELRSSFIFCITREYEGCSISVALAGKYLNSVFFFPNMAFISSVV